MQPGFFDQEDRLAKLEEPGDPMPRLDSMSIGRRLAAVRFWQLSNR